MRREPRGGVRMNLTTDTVSGVVVVRVSEPRLMYPILSDFRDAVTALIGAGEQRSRSSTCRR